MSQVETVALWAGLIASIAGIVLSVAAVVFGVWVNNRATEVNDQTIRSLQKIESAVERLSDDTRNLIKAGWDKMLNTVGTTGGATEKEEEESEHEIAAGLAQEARMDLGLQHETGIREAEHNDAATANQMERIEQVLKNMEQSFAAQLKNLGSRTYTGRTVDGLIGRLEALSPEARALLEAIVNSGHLERQQYQQLAKIPILGDSLRQLRRQGFLVPLSGLDEKGARVPVYWLPPSMGNSVKAAMLLLPRLNRELRQTVKEELRGIGYNEK